MSDVAIDKAALEGAILQIDFYKRSDKSVICCRKA